MKFNREKLIPYGNVSPLIAVVNEFFASDAKLRSRDHRKHSLVDLLLLVFEYLTSQQHSEGRLDHWRCFQYPTPQDLEEGLSERPMVALEGLTKLIDFE